MTKTDVVGVVPVRLESKRLPGKALLEAKGLPIFVHVAKALEKAELVNDIIIATDSEEVAKKAEEFNLEVVITKTDITTGTERCARACEKKDCKVVVNAQGDWPEISPKDIDKLVSVMLDLKPPVGTLYRPFFDEEKANNPNVVKVIKDLNDFAVYFSRLPIPYNKKGNRITRFRHIGIYAFQKDILIKFPRLPFDSPMAEEGLEQLRFLYTGIPIKLVMAEGDPWGIETREDFEAFVQRIENKK